jgi:serine/threonine-protein kinase
VYLLRQLCHSLREAHDADLIHRDIKPANIFVGRYGADTDFTKVLDFGLVKRSFEAEVDPNVTQDGLLIGTPAFIAPEVVMSAPGVDSRGDIYSLGCVAYWLLTGARVFEAETVAQALVRHVNDEPAAPSSRTELDIPQALDAIVLACLEKEPAKRPQTTNDLSESLGAIAFSPPWTEHAARRWWDQHYPSASMPESSRDERKTTAPADR